MHDRFVAEMWSLAHPDHECACADDDLSRASLPLSTPDGRFVDISCGMGHRRRITRRAWDTECLRRRRMQQAPMPTANGVPEAADV
jgi:hypothetical protein